MILYNHRARQKDKEYYEKFVEIAVNMGVKKGCLFSMCYHRGTVRDYVFFCQPCHVNKLKDVCEMMCTGV